MPQEIQETDFIVLRTTRYGEGKLIVNGLTPSGRLSFIAFGAVGGGKKGGLDFELFRLLHVSYQETERELQKCNDTAIIADYGGLAHHFDSYSAACWLSQFSLANMPSGLDCRYFFESVRIALERLAAQSALPAAVITGVVLVYLREGGWLSDYDDSPQTARQIQILLEMALGGDIPRLAKDNWEQLHQWALALLRMNDECIMPGEQRYQS